MLMVIDTLKIYILKICLIIELMFMLGILVNANVYTNLFIPSKLKHLYLFYNKLKIKKEFINYKVFEGFEIWSNHQYSKYPF